ncbi:hypothetical protein TSMEX_007071 [Taenia solium]|eukprot:TsM_001201900 transcript=TsM_001201900 gene=TsM_001201900
MSTSQPVEDESTNRKPPSARESNETIPVPEDIQRTNDDGGCGGGDLSPRICQSRAKRRRGRIDAKEENIVGIRNVDVIDGTRPYSFCEPSESDPLYASVGLPGASATPRNRPEVLTSTAVAVAANSVVATTTKKVDFWNGVDSEDSGGSLALPYYSSILHDPNRSSPFYQEAPAVAPSQSPAVYAQVRNPQVPNPVRMRPNVVYAVPGCQASNGMLSGYRRTVKSQGNHEVASGPPVPSRAYRLSEVEHLLNSHRPTTNQSADCGTDGSNNSHNNERSRRPRSETSFSGLHLLEVLHSGLRRRHNNPSQQQSRIENSSDNRQSTASAFSSVAANTGVIEAPIVPRVSGDYGGNTYGSGKSGHYRNITVRESIASLRARNALPTFLSENRRPPTEAQPLEADYEGVYWYPEEGDAGHEAASRSSFDSHVVAEVATDVGSDAYVEIPDRSRKEEIYAEPSENPPPTQTPPPVRNFNVSRILLEMQDFRYVDSENLSSSVTPPEIVDEGETKETGQVNVNGDEVMQPSPSYKNPTKLRKSDARALPMKAKVRRSQNMTPLMERSMETEPARSPPQSPPAQHPEQRRISRPLPEVFVIYACPVQCNTNVLISPPPSPQNVTPSRLMPVCWFARLVIAPAVMSLLRVLYFCLLLSSFVCGGPEYELLEFTPVNGASHEENIYLTDDRPDVLIDATSRVTRSVYFLGSTSLVTHVVCFSCEVSRRSNPLTDAKLCCSSPGQSLNCHRLLGKPSAGNITCNKISFGYSFDRFRGANFSLEFSAIRYPSFPYDEQIYCEVQDSEATIQSNVIDLRDAMYYATQLNIAGSNKVEKVQPAEISPLDFPLKFSCGNYAEKIRHWPSWMAAVWHRFISPFEWAYCKVGSSTTAVGCAKYGETLSFGGSVTSMDGTLFVLSDAVLAKNPNIAFVCRKRNSASDPILVYAADFIQQTTPRITKGFTLDPAAPPKHTGGFEAISPQEACYQFVEGTLLSDFNLLAFYRFPQSAISSIKTGWFKDGVRLTDPEATATSFRLPDKVERSFAGIYELRIMEGGDQRLKFTFNITVVGPPTFKDINCIDDLFYALEGASKRFDCLLNAQEGSAVELRVGINGFEAASVEQLRKVLGSSLQLQDQPIARLDINFGPIGIHGRSPRGVAVKVMSLAVGQNFRLSVKAINAYGQSLVAGTLRVVPKPALQVSPSSLSCGTDCDEEPFEVQCVPTTAVMERWINLNIVQLQGWVLARTFVIEKVMDDPDLAKYFAFDSAKPHTLHLEMILTMVTCDFVSLV